MLIVYVDADACPVKEEIYRVTARHGLKVKVVARDPMRVPNNERIEMIVQTGFGVVDDWIADQVEAGDIVITSDIPLAARCLERQAAVLSPKGKPFTEEDIGSALALRELLDHLRQGGEITGGPAALTKQDRSRFLSKLDEMIHAMRKKSL